MRRAAPVALAAAWLFSASIASAQDVCVGDCNDDGVVAINELIIGVNIALGSAELSECPSYDIDGNSSVGINELITAVNNALGSCNGEPPGGTERVFVIAQPTNIAAPPSESGSGVFNNILGPGNAAVDIDSAPLTLVLGEPDANGIAALRLKEDVTMTFEIVDGRKLCFQLLAAESAGSIDCDGGTAYDTYGFQERDDTGIPFEIETGLGDPAGPGNGELIIPTRIAILLQSDPQYLLPCTEVTYEVTQPFPFTTTNATADKGGEPLILTVTGEPFDCENFGTPGSGGRLAAPGPAHQPPVGAVVNAFRFAEE